MRCRIREGARQWKLHHYNWWRKAENAFVMAMIGRYLNDGLGAEPPSIEETLRGLRILAVVKQYRRLDAVTALVEMVDRARRKRADHVRNEED